ncbi:M20/M25/M40 family metallo-hydrolase [Phenylobacterium sp. LjRoot225]|uniref:M20/M25/M40 family metallo-hydrolase n=1 Tax=Phenylobacterium sp. LjRoot225 TaxID=3342285 RepID=UPI003ECC61BE
MRVLAAAAASLGLLAGSAAAQAPPLRPDQVQFRAVYKELVETNTTLSAGSCTEAAQKMGARLAQAGFAASDLTYFADPAHPKDGGLVAVLKGSDPKAGAILLLGHIDVVEARREDWTRDPFVLVEENGHFFGRGTADMKGLDAIWVDSLIRLKQAPRPPRRTLKMALTCGEETDGAFNGARWLATQRPDLVAADFGLNEGGGGRLDEQGRREMLTVQVGQKAYQDYRLTVTNPGGHSSRPRPDNAIYQLADALEKVRPYVFPVKLTETTRASLAPRAARGDAVGQALSRLFADPADAEAARVAMTDADVNAILHTNCVATQLAAGHAPNALPQRATANINCRIFPGETVEETRQTLVRLVADPGVKVEATDPDKPLAAVTALDPKVIGPMRTLAAKHFPGVPLVPSISAGATDAVYLGPAKVPIYGVPGVFRDADGGGVHGLNERMQVRALYEGRDYLFELLKVYVGG